MPYIGAGGQEFMSSHLAQASFQQAAQAGGYTTTTGTSQPSWLSSLLQSSQAANVANKQRENEIRGIYDEVIRRYQPGGSFETKSLTELDRLKKRSVTEQFGSSEQQAISGGMFGVQRPTRGGMGMKWEEQVGAPARLSLEDVLMQRLTSAQTGMAGFLERIEDTGPSLSDIFNMAQAGAETSTPTSMPTPEYRKPGSGNIQTPSSTSPRVGGTGGSIQGTKPAGIDWEAKRLADEKAAQKLQAAGRLTFGKTTPEEMKQATTKSSFEELYGGGSTPTGTKPAQQLTINTPDGKLLIESSPGDMSMAKWGYGGYRLVKKLS